MSQLLVCRLDGPSAAIVKRMIEDSITTEKNGLRGFVYIDGRGISEGGFAQGDSWLKGAVNDARKNGLPVIQDNGPAIFPSNYPLRSAAMYFGWYAENVSGVFADKDFHFSPGAVAVHIHSFSASSLHDPGKWWCGPLLEAGAAATLGNVFEPFLHLTTHIDVLEQRLREGFTFAEAAYMAQPSLSWMFTFIGDPLYRPFKFLADGKGIDVDNEWDAYRLGVRVWLDAGRPAGEEYLRAAARRLSSGVLYEGLGLLLLSSNDAKSAIASFALARSAYSYPEDKVRIAVHESGAILNAQGSTDAANFLRKQILTFSSKTSVEILRMLLQTLIAPPPVKAETTTAEKSASPAKPKAVKINR